MSASITSVILAMWPCFINILMTSTARSDIRLARSWIVMVSGSTTSRRSFSLASWEPKPFMRWLRRRNAATERVRSSCSVVAVDTVKRPRSFCGPEREGRGTARRAGGFINGRRVTGVSPPSAGRAALAVGGPPAPPALGGRRRLASSSALRLASSSAARRASSWRCRSSAARRSVASRASRSARRRASSSARRRSSSSRDLAPTRARARASRSSSVSVRKTTPVCGRLPVGRAGGAPRPPAAGGAARLPAAGAPGRAPAGARPRDAGCPGRRPVRAGAGAPRGALPIDAGTPGRDVGAGPVAGRGAVLGPERGAAA